MQAIASTAPRPVWERIRVRGTVQGVGFRPAVWRIANELALSGCVANDSEGVLIEVCGAPALIRELIERLSREAPPLARVVCVESTPIAAHEPVTGFFIAGSRNGPPETGVTADAAVCDACLREIFDPSARRFRYPFTNCTHCGPRLTILEAIPYDRANTTMAGFDLCAACRAEYESPADRRFHAQPIGCHACGPRAELKRPGGGMAAIDAPGVLDACDAACKLIAAGHIVAIKGLGGYQLACDATRPEAVERLRAAKRRDGKPFALMARDMAVVRDYCRVDAAAAALLQCSAAPIVLLDRLPVATGAPMARAVAPGVAAYGFMLPNTGLHHLVLEAMPRPIVLTSGNLSDEPQAVTLEALLGRLGQAADYVLDHDRPIARRIDDSVARIAAGAPRIVRRARGYAPSPLQLPPGFEDAPRVLAFGGELKNTFCLLRGGVAILSQHVGDLENAATRADYRKALADFRQFYEFAPEVLACDRHPEYHSSRLANDEAREREIPLVATQHHHAHIAACLAENGWPRGAGAVIGVALDGLGFGDDGTFWGGEFLIADYDSAERRGAFRPVAMPGGEQAIREPWRNTYAQIAAAMGWARFTTDHAALDLHAFLAAKPRRVLDRMIENGINSPLASSCGRLFDAVAAAAGICRDRAAYEGQGAVEFEALVDRQALREEPPARAYRFGIPDARDTMPLYIEPAPMWEALLGDLECGTPAGIIAARFHNGLATAIAAMVEKLAAADREQPLRTVALSGGVFQNRVLFERLQSELVRRGFEVLTHSKVPCNDGGLALGQAAIAAAHCLRA